MIDRYIYKFLGSIDWLFEKIDNIFRKKKK